MKEFVKEAPNAALFEAPRACHELLFEQPLVRGATLKAITDFLKQNSDSVTLVQAVHPLVPYDPKTPLFSPWEQMLRAVGLVVALGSMSYGISLIVRKSDQ
jgi:hypothetical protein